MNIYKQATLKSRIQRVLLITPQGKITTTKEGSRERKLAIPPLGLAYLAAQLLNHGFEVEVLDTLIEGVNQEEHHDGTIIYGLSDSQIKQRIKDVNPDLIGVSCLFSNRGREALNICKIAKETIPDVHVVLGGQHPTGYPNLISDANVDYILSGEADDSIIELVQAINANANLAEVDGIVLKNGHDLYQAAKTHFPDVKALPYPAWKLFCLEKYQAAGIYDYEINLGEKRFMVLIASRGCPHNCYFCTSALHSGRKYRTREIEDVVAEIRLYQQKYQVEEINFWDDNFFINKNTVKALLRRLIQDFPNIAFQVPSGSEVNAIDEEVIDLMAKAGFRKVFLAVESPNEEIQKGLIDKRVNLGRIPHIVKIIQQAGMIAEGSFMVGFPGETKQQIDNTFHKATSFGFDRISISIVNPLPGTPLYEQCLKHNLLHDDFDVNNIRWSQENIKLEGVPRGYIMQRRREVWVEYMKDKIDIDLYENLKVNATKPTRNAR